MINTQKGDIMSRRIYKGLSILGNGDEVFPPGTLSVNYSNNTINVHNGTTPGGEPLTVSGGGGSLGDLEVTGTTLGLSEDASEDFILIGSDSSGLYVKPAGDNIVKLYATTTDDNTFNDSDDFTSGSYTAGGSGGVISLTGATNVVNYLNNLTGNIVSLEINGGDPIPYDGGGYGGSTVTLNTSVAPSVDPTTITSIRFNIEYEHAILFDVDEGDFGIYIGDENFDIESGRDINIRSGDDLRLESEDGFYLQNNQTQPGSGISIETRDTNTVYGWLFDNTGNIRFPNSTVQTTAYPGIPGPFDDDAAAASAGVSVGNPYYRSSGQVFVRLS